MKIATLKKKACEGSLEIEDLLQAAIEKLPGLPEELARLAMKHGWQSQGLQPDGTRVVPLAKWAEVAAAYATKEFAGLRALAQKSEYMPFVLGLSEQIKTNESVAFILEICDQHLFSADRSEELPFQIAAAFNLLLSFAQPAPVTVVQAKAIQDFLIALYPRATTEARRATVLLALRGVGEQSAIRFVESVPDFAEPWSNTKKAVLRAVRKRIKANAL